MAIKNWIKGSEQNATDLETGETLVAWTVELASRDPMAIGMGESATAEQVLAHLARNPDVVEFHRIVSLRDEGGAEYRVQYSPDPADGGESPRLIASPGATTETVTDYRPDMPAAREWALSATAGDYLVEYEDTGMTAEEDFGSRCGYDDQQLDEIRQLLRRRDLTLEADDRGLVAHGATEDGAS